MKKLFVLLLFVFQVQLLSAQDLLYTQPAKADSLKQALQATTNDTLRLVLYNRIQNYYFFTDVNLDSALFYSRRFLLLTQKLHYKIDEAYAYDLIGSYMSYQLDAQTLKILFQGVRIAEEDGAERRTLPERYLKMMLYWTNDFTTTLAKYNWAPTVVRKMVLASLYNDLGSAYVNTIANQQKLLSYFYKAISIFTTYQDSAAVSNTCFNVATYYESTNQYDSCLYYARKSYELQMQDTAAAALVNQGLIGTMYLKKGNVSEGLLFLRRSIQRSIIYHVAGDWQPYYALAEYYFEHGNTDSSLWYAERASKYVKQFSLPIYEQHASTMLAKVYQATGKFDSAAKYYQLALSYSNVINDIDKKRVLQSQDFDEQLRQQEAERARNELKVYALLFGLVVLALVVGFLLFNNRQRKKTNSLLHQKNKQIESTLQELKAAEAQLIQSEKMASLGELTAGIAHEIQNPLNFVNNFSDVNIELLDDLAQEAQAGNIPDVLDIVKDVKANEQKINHHGKRADAIVKNMLQHSRNNTGQKELTDINALCDEYLRLSYYGLRAKEKSFNADLKTDFDKTIYKVDIVPQEIGRVPLNLFNNAFYAVHEQMKKSGPDYKPFVSISTKKLGNKIEIRVQDNGMGISKSVIDKIFQPFFTTKPAGQGTGLGLSLSYDIIKAHGGELNVESEEEKGTCFTINLPA